VVLYSGYPSDARPRRELETLLAEGSSVDLICLSDEPGQPPEQYLDNLRVTRFSMQHERSGKARYFWQYSQFWLRAFLRLSWRSLWKKYDVVHVHNMPDVLVFTAIVPKLRGARDRFGPARSNARALSNDFQA
jgi:hypothetical protein